MGRLRHHISEVRKLKAQLAEPRHTLELPSGEEVTYTDEDLLDALVAVGSPEGHWLVEALRQAGITVGLEGLVWALDRSWRSQEEEEGSS